MYVELSENYSASEIFEMLDESDKKELLELLLEEEGGVVSKMINSGFLEIRDMLANKKSDRKIVEKTKNIFKEFDVL